MDKSQLAALRESALTHQTDRQVRYPVCLDAEIRAELNSLAEKLQTVAVAAAQQVPEPSDTVPTRRTLADKDAPNPFELRQQAAERAMQPLQARIAQLMEQAKADEKLVVVVFGVAEAAQEDPASWYEEFKAQWPTPSVHSPEVKRALLEASYRGTYTPDSEDLDIDWKLARTKVLNHADLEVLDQAVLELYREPGAIPFDPATFGAQLQS